MKFLLAAGLALAPALAVLPVQAQTPLHQYADADLALGEKLIRDHQCSACHVKKVGGDGSAIYRPAGRINTPGALRGMVEMFEHRIYNRPGPVDAAQRWDAARAAIEKAEGGNHA
jgi:mono/diheme cytochrome c family protein